MQGMHQQSAGVTSTHQPPCMSDAACRPTSRCSALVQPAMAITHGPACSCCRFHWPSSPPKSSRVLQGPTADPASLCPACLQPDSKPQQPSDQPDTAELLQQAWAWRPRHTLGTRQEAGIVPPEPDTACQALASGNMAEQTGQLSHACQPHTEDKACLASRPVSTAEQRQEDCNKGGSRSSLAGHQSHLWVSFCQQIVYM